MNPDFDAMDKALRGGAKSAFTKSTPPGTTVGGPITDVQYRQVTDYSTGQPEFFPSGDPKMQFVVSVQTGAREDADDDGVRSIYINAWGNKRKALLDAFRAAGFERASEGFAEGNVFTATYVEERAMPQGSFREKIYRYEIRRAAHTGIDQALGPQPQAQQYTPRPPVGQPNPWDTRPQAQAQQYAQPSAPARPSPVQAQQDAAPQQAANPADAVKNLIRSGRTDTQIATETGLDASVVAIVRAQLAAAHQ